MLDALKFPWMIGTLECSCRCSSPLSLQQHPTLNKEQCRRMATNVCMPKSTKKVITTGAINDQDENIKLCFSQNSRLNIS
jgi:hypothetical protein